MVVLEDVPCPIAVAGKTHKASEAKTLGVGDDAGLENIGIGECACRSGSFESIAHGAKEQNSRWVTDRYADCLPRWCSHQSQ